MQYDRLSSPVAQRIDHLTTDQKVWGSNPYGRARYISLGHQLTRAPIELRAVEIAA